LVKKPLQEPFYRFNSQIATGKQMKKIAVALVCVIFVCSLVLMPFANADWTMSGSDPAHDGVGTGNPVLTPTLLWNFTDEEPDPDTNFNFMFSYPLGSPSVVNGVVYVCASGQYSSYVIGLNAADGAQFWSQDLGYGYPLGSPAIANSVVYGIDGGHVFALNASDGTYLWSTDVFDFSSSPTVANGILYFGSTGGTFSGVGIYALNASDGSTLWNYTVDSGIDSSPAVANGAVYAISDDGIVYALNASDGAKLWNYTTPHVRPFTEANSSPAVVNGVVYVGWEDGNLYALSADSGRKLWNYTTGGDVESSPAVANGVVYVGSDDDNVYALNAADGKKLWNYTTDGEVSSSPAVAGGVVYVSSDNFYALNAADGVELWNLTGAFLSPVFVDGVVYLCSGETVYAFGSLTPSTPLPTIPESILSPTPSPLISSGTLPIMAGVIATVVVIAVAVFLIFQKRMKTKRKVTHSDIGEAKE
jgi:outer membrane protein assembly factor BamB